MMKRREALNPDITPLIDVVFILLIFFFVTSVFKKDELALTLNLPDSQAKELEIDKKQITLEVTEDKIAYSGETVTLDELNSRLASVENKNMPVIVRIDEKVIYKRIVKILNALQTNGMFNLALVTNEEK